jgi:hypothetical protein
MPIMIWIAIIIMLALEHWIDFAILMAIQFINAFLGWCDPPRLIPPAAAVAVAASTWASCSVHAWGRVAVPAAQLRKHVLKVSC